MGVLYNGGVWGIVILVYGTTTCLKVGCSVAIKGVWNHY